MEEEKKGGIAPIYEEPEILGFKGFWKSYKSVITSALTIFFISVLFSLFGIVAIAMDDTKLWLGVLLYLLFFASYAVFVVLCGKSSAYSSYSIRRLNKSVKNSGRKVPKYKLRQEYKPYKGYLIGVVGSLPLIILVLISFLMRGDVYVGFAAVIKVLYSLFYTPFVWIDNTLHVAFSLVGVLLNVLLFGVSYHLFGMKMQFQQEQIEEEMRTIHTYLDVDDSDSTDV